MTRRRGLATCGAVTIGFFLAPIVGLVTLFGFVLAAEAMGFDGLSQLDRTAQGLLQFAGLADTPTSTPTRKPPPLGFEYGPLATLQRPEPFQPVPPTLSPTATPSTTASATATMMPSESPTETLTATATATLTPSPSPSPSSTTGFYATIAAPATRTPTRTRTRTPTATLTATGSVDVPSTEASGESPTPGAPPAASETPATIPSPTSTPTTPPTASSCDAAANSGVEAQVIALINKERSDEGLKAYSVDSRLTAAARVHATDMACNHFTSHTGSDGSSVRDRVDAQGYDWSWIGENFFVGSGSAQTAVNWWMNSAPHTANILSPNYTQFGVGYVYDADSDYKGYFVIVFAKPG